MTTIESPAILFSHPADFTVPPAGSCGTAKDRMEGHEAGVECEDWFFCTRELPAGEVESAIHRG